MLRLGIPIHPLQRRESFRLQLAAVALALAASGHAVPTGAAPGWASYDKWTGTYTVTISFQSALPGGRTSTVRKLRGSGTLDEKTSTVDETGAVHVSWFGRACRLEGEIDEDMVSRDKDGGSVRYTNRGRLKPGTSPDCAELRIDPDEKTYSVMLPSAEMEGEGITTITSAEGAIADRTTVSAHERVFVPLDNCCPGLPLPGAGGPLKGTRTIVLDGISALVLFNYEGPPPTATAVLTWEFSPQNPAPDEAVIEPEGGYDDWVPEAPSGTYEPRPLEIHVRLHKKGDPGKSASQPARFRFELVDTSQEPGYCLNAPKRDDPDFTPPPPDEPFDLEIGAKDNPALKISDKGQRAETKDGLTEATVSINPADWGGYTKLKVTAILKDGTEVVAHLASDESKRELRVPVDDNDNHIADGWEKVLGIFDRNLPADWNESDDPAGQLSEGDGISLYEKYRGFEFDGRHERLQPAKKYLFLFDEDGVYKTAFTSPYSAGLDFARLSKLEIRLLADTEWTGTGSVSGGHRIVNFNHRTGHAIDQHGLHLALSNPWSGASVPAGFFGITWPDGPDVFGPPRVALKSVVDTGKASDSVIAKAVAAVCALPRPGGPLPYPDCERDAIAKAYADQHLAEITEGIFKFVALVINHELAHAVGVQHHDAKEDGSRTCVMRYFRKIECGVDPRDPVDLKCRSPWPAMLVGPDPQSHAGMGCYQQIVINDAR